MYALQLVELSMYVLQSGQIFAGTSLPNTTVDARLQHLCMRYCNGEIFLFNQSAFTF